MKKVITFILTLVLAVCLFGCDGCSKIDKTNPVLPDGDAELASIKETVNGTEYKYVATKNAVYNYLKSQYGSTVMINMLDSALLKSLKDENGTSFFDSIKEEDIRSEIDESVYGEDTVIEELTETEKQEMIDEFLDTMFISYGCVETSIYADFIMEQFRVSLAQRAYAKSVLAKEIADTDKAYEEYEAMTDEEKAEVEEPVTAPYYTEANVKAKYDADNLSTYKAIIIPFTSARQAEIALSQIGVSVNADGVWSNGTTALAANEVLNKFIELYSLVYGYQIDETLTKESEEFEFTETELSALNSNVASYLKDNMELFDEDSTNVNPKWYTATPYVVGSGTLHTFVLKLGETVVSKYDDLDKDAKAAAKTTYLDDLMEDSLTSTYILTKMAEIRAEKNLIIYDSVIENAYISSLSSLSLTHEATAEESTDTIAQMDDISITVTQLYDRLISQQGVSGITEELVKQRLLHNPVINPYYDMANNKWLDEDMEDQINDLIASEKQNFRNGTYVDYGYDPDSMSWDLYIRTVYSVKSETELAHEFLVETISSEYTDGLNYIVNYDTNSEGDKEFDMTIEEAKESALWKQIEADMQAKADKGFNVAGIELVIASYETVSDYINNRNAVDPEDWTEAQKTAASELVTELIAFLKDSKGTYSERIDKVVQAFKFAPISNKAVSYNGNEVALTLTSDNGNAVVNVSKYKELGLAVKSADLGTFTNGKYSEEYDAVVKAIWDNDAARNVFNDSSLTTVDKVTIASEAVVTTDGYHLYVNLESKERSYAHRNSTTTLVGSATAYEYVYIPTLEEIRTYTLNSSDTSLSTNVKTAITTYYTPIASELVGDYFTYSMRYAQLSALADTFTCTTGLTGEAITRYIDLYNAYSFETYVTTITAEYLTK